MWPAYLYNKGQMLLEYNPPVCWHKIDFKKGNCLIVYYVRDMNEQQPLSGSIPARATPFRYPWPYSFGSRVTGYRKSVGSYGPSELSELCVDNVRFGIFLSLWPVQFKCHKVIYYDASKFDCWRVCQVCIQLIHFSDFENTCTLSYYHRQIWNMNHLAMLRVRSWNNVMRCMSFYSIIGKGNDIVVSLIRRSKHRVHVSFEQRFVL